MRAAVQQTIETFGQLDVAIANAGILGRGATFRNLTTTEIERVMAVNVNGAVNTASAALEAVIERQGQIVIISSVYAFVNGAGALPYAMSKAAVAQLGRGLSIRTRTAWGIGDDRLLRAVGDRHDRPRRRRAPRSGRTAVADTEVPPQANRPDDRRHRDRRRPRVPSPTRRHATTVASAVRDAGHCGTGRSTGRTHAHRPCTRR